MTAVEIVARVREVGGDIELLPDGYKLALRRRRSIPDELAAVARERAQELRLLLRRQSRVESGLGQCVFTKGGKLCSRCLSWLRPSG